MSISRKKALEYADQLISRPRGRLTVKLRQGQEGVTLLHQGKALTKCHLNRSGMRAATYMAQALGVKVPALGATVEAQVSTAVIWRAVSISCLNFRKQASYILLERLLAEAEQMRGSSSEEG
ncbi:MAG: hypothetical protein EXR54_06235 [Dehalococcoidia bacterium]|nr:hypothetical protein [Dehalococcoidia bacterium]MSQ17153.1 hypothetical protein [Dehalococcoidia bacterium]